MNCKIDKKSGIPLYKQLFDTLSGQIREGILRPGEKLPTKRALSESAGVSLNTVITVYDTLVKEGLVNAVERVGYFVAGAENENIFKGAPWSVSASKKYVFSINGNGIKTLPKKLVRARHDAEYELDSRLLSYKEYTGNTLLRERICAYLYKSRRIRCTSEQVIITSGNYEILDTCARLLGNDLLYAFENPTQKKMECVISQNRRAVYIPTRLDGFSIDDLYRSGADVFFCMPEKQYPVGYTLSLEDRYALLDWAGDKRYLIEYGYNHEFHFKEPYPALYDLDARGRVIYINSFDRITAPGITLSYMVIPKELVPVFKSKLWYYHAYSSEFDSLVVSEFIAGGGLKSHIEKLRKAYQKKRDTALEAFQSLTIADKISYYGIDTGTHFCIHIDTKKTETELMARASLRDIKILPVSFFHSEPAPQKNAFIVGYAEPSEADLKSGIQLLGETWKDL